MSIHPTMASALAPFSPQDSTVRKDALPVWPAHPAEYTPAERESAKRADLAYDRMKRDGTLQRENDAQALRLQVQHGDGL